MPYQKHPYNRLPDSRNPSTASLQQETPPQPYPQELADPVVYQPQPRAASLHPDYPPPPPTPRLKPAPSTHNLYAPEWPTDFGPPPPHAPPAPYYRNPETNTPSYSSSSLGVDTDQQSSYGSMARLRDMPPLRDGAYRNPAPLSALPPPPRRTAYTYPPEASPPVPYHDGSSASGRTMNEKEDFYIPPKKKTKKKTLIWVILICLLLLIAAAVVLVYFLVIKPKTSSSTGTHGNTTTGNNTQQQVLTTGGDGSIVTKSDGTKFTYNNTFGGYWVYDMNNPLNNSARAQSYTPPLSDQWKFGQDRIYGVNLGGWLVLEPFISPALYEPFYPDAIDEWTLSTLIKGRDGNLDAIAHHYDTFIVEEDFAQIAAAGLNWVRIPLPFWAIEAYPEEPFLAKTSWTYFLKAIEWARKYGLRINLDLHTAPGSQNGWNHSGKTGGNVNFLAGVMGIANAQRTLDYIRILAEFISQPEYRDVVPFFGIINEPLSGANGQIPKEALRSFYAEAYKIVRTAGGSGAGNGPVVSIYEAFWGLEGWTDYLPGADRLALDAHTYMVFTTYPDGNPADFTKKPCDNWGASLGGSMSTYGITAAGEWSNAINDCGLYVTGVTSGTLYEGTKDPTQPRLGSCSKWIDYSTWDESIKAGLRDFSASSMDALGDSFFWTWRIGEASSGKVESPFWSYKLAIQEGWALTDPRTSAGQCQRLGSTGNSFYATGGTLSGAKVGAGVVDAIAEVPSLSTYAWPPAAIGLFNDTSTLPLYPATGPIPTLPVPSQPVATPAPTHTADFGTGWMNSADNGLMHVPIAGCAYPDPWNASNAAIPVC